MNGGLKTLIASACFVVIAGGGYHAWSQSQDAKTAEELQGQMASKARCDRRLKDMTEGRIRSDDQNFMTGCIFLGYTSDAEIEAAKEKMTQRR